MRPDRGRLRLRIQIRRQDRRGARGIGGGQRRQIHRPAQKLTQTAFPGLGLGRPAGGMEDYRRS